MSIPQQDPQVALGIPPKLVRKDEAQGSGVGWHHRAHELSSLPFCLQACFHVQVAVELWGGRYDDLRLDCFVKM